MLDKILKTSQAFKKTIKTVIVIVLIAFVLVVIYGIYALFTRMPSQDTLNLKEEELKAFDIRFDQKTVSKVKERKENGLPLDLSGLGRGNPFLNF